MHESLSIASSLNSAREKSYKGAYLATALLLAGDIAGAQEAAFTAQRAQFTVNQPVVGAIHGVTLVRLGELDEAARTFSYAIKQASELIEHTHGLYTLWYARALAHAGQVLTGESTIDDAMRDYRHAQALCAERGVLRANARLLEALREADGDGLIASLPPLPAE